MNSKYKEKLIKLAEDLKDEMKPKNYISDIASQEQTNNIIRNDEIRVGNKINYLLGYILSLKEL